MIWKFGNHMQGQLKMTQREEDKELRQYEAMIRKIAAEFNLKYNNKYDIEDLEQVARMGVLAAIRNYDPQFKTKKLVHAFMKSHMVKHRS